CLVAGLFFAIPQFLVSNHLGPELVDIIASAVSIGAVYVLLKVWQPKKLWRFEGEAASDHTGPKPTTSAALPAWMPWIVLSTCVSVGGGFTPALNRLRTPPGKMPSLPLLALKGPPLVPRPTPEAATWAISWLSATGTALLVAGIISGLALGLSPKKLLSIYGKT